MNVLSRCLKHVCGLKQEGVPPRTKNEEQVIEYRNSLFATLSDKNSSTSQVFSQAALLEKPFQTAIILGVTAVYKEKIKYITASILTGFAATDFAGGVTHKLVKSCTIALILIVGHIAIQILYASYFLMKKKQEINQKVVIIQG